MTREDDLKNISQRHLPMSVDWETLKSEKERLLREIRQLEEENHALSRQSKALQLQVLDCRQDAQSAFHRSEGFHQQVLGLQSQENNLNHELIFLESERKQARTIYREVAGRIDQNMTAIAAMLRDIEFFRGEMETLMDQTGCLEDDAPSRFRDVDSLNEQIDTSAHALKHLYARMKSVEKTAKAIYYRRGN